MDESKFEYSSYKSGELTNGIERSGRCCTARALTRTTFINR